MDRPIQLTVFFFVSSCVFAFQRRALRFDGVAVALQQPPRLPAFRGINANLPPARTHQAAIGS